MRTETYTVLKMSCSNCEKRVQDALKEQQGVVDVYVSLKDNQATITYDETQTNRDELKEIVDDIGYEMILFS